MGGLSSKPCPWNALSESPILVDTGTVDLPGGLASSTALLRTKAKGKTVTVLDGFDKTAVLYSVKKKHGKGTVTNASGQLILKFVSTLDGPGPRTRTVADAHTEKAVQHQGL